ncbi:signal recognition particle-docking protein FtsY [Pseudoalteromonas sp. MMG010]|uniref:signal recognition particle-docking protein FtsY n=1 Tax=Pseudoalteromonas sp. MMG010 TaxID=2822685 RepID=UPI001B3A1C56|nr:signal recognition particle-docking protein FtsY [Pseudoalteromonas sp. MMG010]MBQ4832952.1 signal recognition particle-docking protein FtsY [Pseudoalteromonas sp. MMG010]
MAKKSKFMSWFGFGKSDKKQTEQAEAERLAAEQAEQEQLAAEQEKLAIEQANAELLAKEHADAEKLKAEEAKQAQLAAEQAEQERVAQAQLAQEQAEQARLAQEQEKIAIEQANAELLAKEHADAEKLKAEEAKQAQLAQEQAEKERVAQAQLAQEQARLAQEALAAEEAEQARLAQEKLAAEQAEQARLAQEKLAAEQAEQARLAQEKLAAEQAEQERLAQEKLAAEQAEQARLAQEKLAAEQAEQARLAQEKLAAEQAEEERLAQEKLAAEQAEQARLAQEKLAAEEAEQARLAQEKLAAEEAEQARLAQEKLAAEEAEQARLAQEELAAEEAEQVRLAQEETAQKPKKEGFFSRLKKGLLKTRVNIGSGFASIFSGKKIDDDLFEELETQLLTADLGVDTTMKLIDNLTDAANRKQLKDGDALYELMKQEMATMLKTAEQPLEMSTNKKPFVILMVGVNGVGKTTTIGKLAKQFQNEGKSVMLAAGDTFRAAAVEQLQVWGERNEIPVIAQHTGADSASVVFDAFQAAKARNVDVLIADTAGRLQNKDNLMQELEKIARVMKKIDPDAPHEVMLTIDAGTGQNAISQVNLFNQCVGLTGITLSKLDGTAKGGVIFAVADKFNIPIRYIGVGEGIDDLREFNSNDFIEALFSQDEGEA